MSDVIRINKQLHGDTSKSDLCKILKENSEWYENSKSEKYSSIDIMKTILSKRLPKDVYHGIVDFLQSFRDDTSSNEIKNALVNLLL